MPVYKDKDKWRVVYTTTDYLGNTKQTTKRGFTTKKQAKEWEAKQISSNKTTADIFFSSMLEKYMTYKANYLKRSSLNSYKTRARSVICFFGDKKITDYSIRDISNAINQNKTFSNATINVAFTFLLRVLKFAEKHYNIYYDHSLEKFDYLPTKHKKIRVWTTEQFEDFVSYLEKIGKRKDIILIFKLLFYCGIRIGEALALQFKDIDGNQLHITKSMNLLREVTTPKTKNSSRVITIPSKLEKEIREYRTTHTIEPNNYICYFSYHYLWKILINYCKKHNMEVLSLHDLRHSHATILINSGMPISAVSDRLGHSNPNVTLSIYTHTNEENKKHLDTFISNM